MQPRQGKTKAGVFLPASQFLSHRLRHPPFIYPSRVIIKLSRKNSTSSPPFHEAQQMRGLAQDRKIATSILQSATEECKMHES